MAVCTPSCKADESISSHPAGIELAEVWNADAGIMQVFEISMESQLTINTNMIECKRERYLEECNRISTRESLKNICV